MSSPIIDCRHFNGYKPCGKAEVCDSSCPSKDRVSTRILLIHLGALGAVVRSTALLKSIKRKFPNAHLTWVTDAPAHRLLQSHPGVDRVLTTSESDLLSLSALQFDFAFVVDKSLKAAGVLAKTKADMVFGFVIDGRSGAILPATEAAEELWHLGLNNHQKFHVNQKSEIQLATEALELGPWTQEEYWLPLDTEQAKLVSQRRTQFSSDGTKLVVGFNTGCSDVIAAKKLTVESHRELIRGVLARGDVNVVLLGGPEDTIRNQAIGKDLQVFQTPTENGLRDGYASVAACDIIVTGDSLGMHLAIAAAKWTVAWFGPTCAHEIELYGRGEKILASSTCSPCWKRFCDRPVMCYDEVELKRIEAAIDRGLKACRMENPLPSLSKQPSLGI